MTDAYESTTLIPEEASPLRKNLDLFAAFVVTVFVLTTFIILCVKGASDHVGGELAAGFVTLLLGVTVFLLVKWSRSDLIDEQRMRYLSLGQCALLVALCSCLLAIVYHSTGGGPSCKKGEFLLWENVCYAVPDCQTCTVYSPETGNIFKCGYRPINSTYGTCTPYN